LFCAFGVREVAQRWAQVALLCGLASMKIQFDEDPVLVNASPKARGQNHGRAAEDRKRRVPRRYPASAVCFENGRLNVPSPGPALRDHPLPQGGEGCHMDGVRPGHGPWFMREVVSESREFSRNPPAGFSPRAGCGGRRPGEPWRWPWHLHSRRTVL
jgi:hypothetical protein